MAARVRCFRLLLLSGLNPMVNALSAASAIRARVRTVGEIAIDSIPAIVDCGNPARLASSSCVRPGRIRISISGKR